MHGQYCHLMHFLRPAACMHMSQGACDLCKKHVKCGIAVLEALLHVICRSKRGLRHTTHASRLELACADCLQQYIGTVSTQKTKALTACDGTLPL